MRESLKFNGAFIYSLVYVFTKMNSWGTPLKKVGYLFCSLGLGCCGHFKKLFWMLASGAFDVVTCFVTLRIRDFNEIFIS